MAAGYVVQIHRFSTMFGASAGAPCLMKFITHLYTFYMHNEQYVSNSMLYPFSASF